MVRFSMDAYGNNMPEWEDLHSTMVRFSISKEKGKVEITIKFTFHYG